MDDVRWAVIGLGSRGCDHLGTILQMDKAHLAAICDTHENLVTNALGLVRDHGSPVPTAKVSGPDHNAWQEILERDDIDAVVIATSWQQHAPMAIAAMQAGKHAFVEVPIALTIEECWQLVDTSEATGKHCMMLENCNYGREELMLLNMVRQGLLGEILHGEAAYLHELRFKMLTEAEGAGTWRTNHYVHDNGNLYPTHGVGPLAHCMDVNRGDNFDYLVSMSSPARGRQLFARENFPPEHHWNQIDEWKCGDINTSIIKLNSGKTMMVQWDETSPRPYSRHNYLQGTRGAFGSFPNRIALDYPLDDLPAELRTLIRQKDGRTDYHEWETEMEPWFAAYDHPLWREVGAMAQEHGGHDGMDFIMFWRIQQCLLQGKPMDQSVYDGVLWSAITPLTRQSLENGSAPAKFPDFSRGKWQTTPRIEIDDYMS